MKRKFEDSGLPAGKPVNITAEDLPFYTYGLPAVLQGYAEVAVFLRLPEHWVKAMAEDSDMPSVRTGCTVTFPTGALVRWLFARFPNKAPTAKKRGIVALQAKPGNDEARGPKSEGGAE